MSDSMFEFEGEMAKRWGEYYPYLLEIGYRPLHEKVIMKDINPTSGVMQAVYKDIKKYKFDGNFIDWMCWLSSLYVLTFARKDVSLIDYVEFLKDTPLFTAHLKNMLRLFNRKPELFDKWGNAEELLSLWYKYYKEGKVKTWKDK